MIHHGDCVEVMAGMELESVDTDPTLPEWFPEDERELRLLTPDEGRQIIAWARAGLANTPVPQDGSS